MGSSCGTLVMALVLMLVLVDVTVNAQNYGCANNLCCNKYGYCGTTSDYFGDGYQSGPCTSLAGGSPTTGDGNMGTIISHSVFDGLVTRAASSCEGKGFYTYDAFIAAANAYSGFGTTGSSDDQKTGGLCYINEINPAMIYCDTSSTSWPCASGKSYHGRGPLHDCHGYNGISIRGR